MKAQNTNTKEICGDSIDHDHITLQQILLHDQSTFCNGKKKAYIERNTSIGMLKAIAITVFSTAAQKAADVTGVSVNIVFVSGQQCTLNVRLNCCKGNG